MAKTDLRLKQDIERELRWDPKVNATQVSVRVDKGAVTLLGRVDTYAEKWAAGEAAKRVADVRTIALDLTVEIRSDHERSDSELVAAVQNALARDLYVPKTVSATVQHGAVTLAGQVPWNYQRNAAEQAVRPLDGVVTISNSITLAPQADPEQPPA